jgi:DNA-binding MarR family transcriptional regulator
MFVPEVTVSKPSIGPDRLDARAAFDDALVAFFRAARRARGRAARRPPESGLSLAQFHVLEPLRDGPQPMYRVAEDAGIAPPTATRMLDGLVERGYVDRALDPADRRVVLVSLTESGRRAVRRKAKEFEQLRAGIAAAFDEDEQRIVTDLLHRLVQVLEEL